MTTESAGYEDEYEEYDEFDDDDEEEDRGLSGLVVLLMGVVMLGAFASVVWIAYQQGIKSGGAGEAAPYVTADPDPVKIENEATADAADNVDREVYDRFDGGETNPVETIAEGPEEPLTRDTADPIGAIAAEAGAAAEIVDDAVADRITELAAADEELTQAVEDAVTADVTDDVTAAVTADVTVETPSPAPARENADAGANVSTPAPTVTFTGDALSGSHLVQIGAFRSDEEAKTNWTRIKGKLGGFADGKSIDVERADLGARGVFHRLRVGPFASSDEAKTYCVGLKERGQDCLAKAK